jgi:hypothetical protein
LKAKGFIVDGSQGRADKLTEANERLLYRISGINSTIDAANQVVGQTITSLIQVSREKSARSVRFIEMLGDMKALVNSHIGLMRRASQNRQVVLLLLHIALALGQDLLAGNPPDSEVAKLLQAQFRVIIAQLQEEDEAAAAEALALAHESNHQEESEREEPITAAEIFERLTTFRRRKRTPAHGRPLATDRRPDGLSTQRQAVQQPDAKRHVTRQDRHFFVGRPRLELLHGMAIGAELAGFLVGVDRPFREKISAFIRPVLREASDEVRVSVNGFGGAFIARLSETNVLANRILVRTKESIAVQTDVAARDEVEVQTGDPPGTKPKPAKKK